MQMKGIAPAIVLLMLVSAFGAVFAPAEAARFAPAEASSQGKSILIYGPSLSPPRGPFWTQNEKTIATSAGYAVTVAYDAMWSRFTAADFAAFDAIVFGDPTCALGTSRLSTANANKAVWSSVIDGPMIVTGTSPQLFQFKPGGQALLLIMNGINFAASGSGTGLYVSLSCYYLFADRNTPVDFLSEIGDFRVGGREGCTETVRIVDSAHPAMAGLTDAGLSDWNCSPQEFLLNFPTSFEVLATAVRPLDRAVLPFTVATPAAPTEVSFVAFSAEVELEEDEYEVEGIFTLGGESNGIDPRTEEVTVSIGDYVITIPAGRFILDDESEFKFEGMIDGVKVEMEIELDDDGTWEFEIEGEGATLVGLENPVEVTLAIGDDSGTTTVDPELEFDDDEDGDEEDEDEDMGEDDDEEENDDEDGDEDDEDDD